MVQETFGGRAATRIHTLSLLLLSTKDESNKQSRQKDLDLQGRRRVLGDFVTASAW